MVYCAEHVQGNETRNVGLNLQRPVLLSGLRELKILSLFLPYLNLSRVERLLAVRSNMYI